EGRAFFPIAPRIILFPGAALALMILAVNVLGDGLRDRLDPKLARRGWARHSAAARAICRAFEPAKPAWRSPRRPIASVHVVPRPELFHAHNQGPPTNPPAPPPPP